ncbi:hypothetical protein E3983_03735 [Legionella israelensis]|uniref:Uncharacterized protein n=1 Tax=Legionella israelensis TaxID=454 RepID=A0A0W0WIH0_9GAMM|nr:hypothetical protein [Legionella israelensis]KTD32035.1 hypothetical protein Lisr_0508 [Legionella israelensis]QBR83546.1 hypothetical protein E3983_03735 [Legionella israelensis]QBS09078.1 hypothetical protein E4T55_03940 [Legionella israelensis]SCY08745.1 hypothetical protein SAMN02746069_01237 [Legionella israelensis DSM 19235]STX58797.1 Uncharacterised protein [Legionella israelensis]
MKSIVLTFFLAATISSGAMAAPLVDAPAAERHIVHFKLPNGEVVKARVTKEDAQTMEKMKKDGKLHDIRILRMESWPEPKEI